jgi:hypothetical protein
MKLILLLVVLLSFAGCKRGPDTVYIVGETVVVEDTRTSGILLDITTESTQQWSRYGSYEVTKAYAHVSIEYMDDKMQKQNRVIVVPIDRIYRPVKVEDAKTESK